MGNVKKSVSVYSTKSQGCHRTVHANWPFPTADSRDKHLTDFDYGSVVVSVSLALINSITQN